MSLIALLLIVLAPLNAMAMSKDACLSLFRVSSQGTEISVDSKYIVNGELQVPVFSDVHGNIEGLFFAIRDLQALTNRKYPVIFVTGDLGFYPDLAGVTPEEMARDFRGQNDFGIPQFYKDDRLYKKFYSETSSLRSLVAKIYFVRGNHDSTKLLRGLNQNHTREIVEMDRFGVLNYLTDGSLVRLKWAGQNHSIGIATYGGIAGESRPKAFSEEPGLDFDEEAGIELLTQIAQHPDSRPTILLTHQGLESMPGGHSSIDAICDLLAPAIHICGHGHRNVGPILSGRTQSFEVRRLGTERRPSINEGRVLLLNINQSGDVGVVPSLD